VSGKKKKGDLMKGNEEIFFLDFSPFSFFFIFSFFSFLRCEPDLRRKMIKIIKS